ncbi:hypothetical protein, partial [Butyricicoccus sp. AF35-5AC]|uniref:hypothetical protein n=1 Tax=Butyricicoccus sp. AF35-5AC TaxID=2292003 RepID=UPI001A9A57C3
CRPDRANRLRQFECPGQPVLKRSRPSGVNRLRGSSTPGVGAGKQGISLDKPGFNSYTIKVNTQMQ